MERFDTIIAGAGLNGGTLALALARAGLRVALVDPAPARAAAETPFTGRSYALSIGSRNLLRALGLWGDLAGNAQPILGIRVSDGRVGSGPSPLALAFDHAEIEEGPMGHMVEDRHLRPALAAALEGAGITHLPGVTVTGHEAGDGGVSVTLSDGRQIAGALLVGADGAESPSAHRAGIRKVGWSYGQVGLVAAIGHEKDHQGVAHQLFLPEGPLAILPLTGNRASIVWTETAANARRIMSLPPEDYLAILRPRFGDFMGPITLEGERHAFPLRLSLATRFVAPRLALLGDAAHAVHPIAGQGLNAGLKDVAALAEVLVDARRRGEEIGRADVLGRYERWRRFDAAALAVATDGINRLFSNDSAAMRLARDLGLAAVNALPGLRRGFIREAAGLTGDRPRLLAGKPL